MILVNENIKQGNTFENCQDKFLPPKLKDVPFYANINTLVSTYDNSWTDDEMRSYFDKDLGYERFFISDLNDKEKLYTKDFYETYPTNITDIWYEAGLLNDKTILKEGVDFWGFILEPYLGTNLIQQKLIQKVDVRTWDYDLDELSPHGEVIEWWEHDQLPNTYLLRMFQYPGSEKLIFLIQSSLKIKNISSKLTSVTDWLCPSALRLNVSSLNINQLNGNFINYYFDIGLCFSNYVEMFSIIDYNTEDEYTYEDYSDLEDYENRTPIFGMINGPTNNYNIGLALGELDGVSYEDVLSSEILGARYFYGDPIDQERYDNFVTGITNENLILRGHVFNMFCDNIPG